MAETTQADSARKFLALHHGSTFLLPNAWDAMSALIIEDVGFASVATSSGGLSWALGWPDGERAPWPEIVAATGRIARSLHIPLSADIEGGFADTLGLVKTHVTQIIEAGAVCINLEDQHVGELRDIQDACARIRAAREAGDEAGVPLVINARTDVFHLGALSAQSIDLALKRADAYLKAGASCIFLFGLADLETLSQLTKRIAGPVNVVGRAGSPSLARYAEAGVKRVSLAAGLSLRAYGAVADAATHLFETGNFDDLRTSFTRARAQKLTSSGSE